MDRPWIELGDKLVLTATSDGRNWVTVRCTDDGDPVSSTRRYHTDLATALESASERRLRRAPATTLAELLAALESLRSEIADAVEREDEC